VPPRRSVPAFEPCRLLPWDSEFWGFGIARVEGNSLDAARAGEVEEWARARDVRCAYFLAGGGDHASAAVAAARGYRLVGVRVELDRAPAHGGEAISRWREQDLPRLRAIARMSHRDTRFYADRNFDDDRCGDFYETWIARSCEGWANEVLVVGQAEGYVSCHLSDGVGSIGLIAVAEDARGRGFGLDLVRAAAAWLTEAGAERLTVVTQGHNIAAQRTFQRAGYRTADTALWFHRWFE
jgi:dTDP-4-amino-4,6-dideoxy-D-galactose acyltransferase